MFGFEWGQEVISNSVDDTWAIAEALVKKLPALVLAKPALYRELRWRWGLRSRSQVLPSQ